MNFGQPTYFQVNDIQFKVWGKEHLSELTGKNLRAWNKGFHTQCKTIWIRFEDLDAVFDKGRALTVWENIQNCFVGFPYAS